MAFLKANKQEQDRIGTAMGVAMIAGFLWWLKAKSLDDARVVITAYGFTSLIFLYALSGASSSAKPWIRWAGGWSLVLGHIGMLSAIFGPGSLELSEVAARGAVLLVVYAIGGWILGYVAGRLVQAKRAASEVARSAATVVADKVQAATSRSGATPLERKLDEIEHLYRAGKLSDSERAEARARVLRNL